ncbi:MAG: hypothetical protein GEU93_21285 [Propionibacteriales bacterium]|nr:hypothetical protein [Propionibacteriales bacterium]
MSLNVSPDLLSAAEQGEIDEQDFVRTIRESLPYAWDTVSRVATELGNGTAEFADNQIPPPDETARGQLLRALASNSIRGGLEKHFGVRLAFQNCHRVAAFPAHAEMSDSYQEFVSPRSQLLNQSPLLRNC